MGGFVGPNLAADHEIYHAATGAWSPATQLPVPRAGLAAVTGHDGLIYALGGWPHGDAVTAYDPKSDTWIPKAAMLTPRWQLGAVTSPDGLIYAIGGANNQQGLLASVEIFDPTKGTTGGWEVGPPLPLPLAGVAAAVGPDGLIYAIGGAAQGVNEAVAQAEVYSCDPKNPTAHWVPQAPLQTARGFVGAATGPDGRIYAIGGWARLGQFLSTVEALTVPAAQSAPDPYIGGGSDQSSAITLLDPTNKPVPIGTFETFLQSGTDYGVQATIYNDSSVAAPNTRVRFWRLAPAGSTGTQIDAQTVTVPANGAIVVTAANTFHCGSVAAPQEVVAVTVANPASPYFSVDPTRAAQVSDPTMASPPGSGHYGTAWRLTTAVTHPHVSACQSLINSLASQLADGQPKLLVGNQIGQQLEGCYLSGQISLQQYEAAIELIAEIQGLPGHRPGRGP
jgi:hypothetical protein